MFWRACQIEGVVGSASSTTPSKKHGMFGVVVARNAGESTCPLPYLQECRELDESWEHEQQLAEAVSIDLQGESDVNFMPNEIQRVQIHNIHSQKLARDNGSLVQGAKMPVFIDQADARCTCVVILLTRVTISSRM